MRCDQCRHWKRDDDGDTDWSQRWTGHGTCKRVRERWRVMEEATDGKRYEDFVSMEDWDMWDDGPPPAGSYTGIQLDALKQAKAVVQDGSDYHAELITAPDFFCALFASCDGGDSEPYSIVKR